MKRLTVLVASLFLLAGGAPTRTVLAAQASCCWLYCESYRTICQISFGEDEEYCDAFYEGCIDGCQYPNR